MSTPAELPELARLQATLQDEQRTLIRAHIKRVEAVLSDGFSPRPTCNAWCGCPGSARLGAYTLVLEIDDVQRFPPVRHFHSYWRLMPGADNSAAKTRHKRSRDGNR